ncbi:hypothetical protein C8R46DRAFT_1026660 [Mycena filopes]|nr:hypothetical protein C8R46DRAFT_1026660 [Mycena filopes]
MSSRRPTSRPWAPPQLSSIYGPPNPSPVVHHQQFQSSPAIYAQSPVIYAQSPATQSQPPAPMASPPCDQCHADRIIEYERQKLRPRRAPSILPHGNNSFARPANGPSAVIFEPKYPDQAGGVLLTDLLEFRDCLIHPGAPVLRHAPGTVSVGIEVGSSTYFEDIPGNCEHRPITAFNLAWWLAKHLQNNLGNNINGMYLLSLWTQNGRDWTAKTRF